MKGRKVGELMEDLEALASRRASSPDHRVLCRLDPANAGGPKIRGGSVRRAAIVDVETTGLDSEGRLLEPIGDIPPAEFEQAYYRQQESVALAA